ncbi:type II toxin-antitoxin system Phd/YefM family antitoxin [Corallococcus exiguus]|uniref:type II toxin-antitoxin system Phd/YefM family antitoxin n=1 Tax=Corallococcus TaxID=83461 RepID=UPI000EA170F7|nr:MULTISPECIES: type II toxin-antitoxin system Phd/YefM family antitoxin [Corallococcus]RKI36243.1 type II toxin-antitoxin system Phd/YefM family antitoxin [Corallococcus sp. AB004]NNC19431.1 type II toxin-antitoxin system Phd/YefM family antitoxin [Corallococcus exiguus]NPC73956.1 type II toxin-antitoxin system Phd/YefM family antitoxin [Corallococcus exiguus]NPD27966.1 type II toxin-antitoxin system Phd/YefM family antitoxin [Corallococcus exiguus]NRD48483.1 type II toxin-antitoxin system P
MMEVSITEARDDLAELLNRAAYGKERLVLTRHGKKLVAVIPFEDLQALEALEDRRDIQKADAARRESEGQPRVAWKQVKAELGLAKKAKKTASGRSPAGGPARRSTPRAGRPRPGR